MSLQLLLLSKVIITQTARLEGSRKGQKVKLVSVIHRSFIAWVPHTVAPSLNGGRKREPSQEPCVIENEWILDYVYLQIIASSTARYIHKLFLITMPH